ARSGQPSFYVFDGHSGVRMLTDAAGAVTDRYTYDAYGVPLRSMGSTVNPYRYRGEQTDAGLGWQYLRARYYDPATGRFVSTDPSEGVLTEPESLHRYLYANASPVGHVDPSGRQRDLISVTVALLALTALPGVELPLQQLAGAGLSLAYGEERWKGTLDSVSISVIAGVEGLHLKVHTTSCRFTQDAGFGVRVPVNEEYEWLMIAGGISLRLSVVTVLQYR